MEYYAYKPDKRWYAMEIFKVIMCCLVVAIIFYDRIFVAPLLFPVGVYIWKNDRKKYKRSVVSKLSMEFKEFIILLSGELNAGYSLEQGIKKTYGDMVKDDSFSIIPRELALIVNGLGLNKDVEELLMDMGERCQHRDIIEFARLVATAKRFGGNINNIIHKTKKKLNEKIIVEREIDTMVSAKNLEGHIMLLMPFGIVFYMRLTNGGYIESLYNSGVGILVATVGLVMVLICGLSIRKITEIEV